MQINNLSSSLHDDMRRGILIAGYVYSLAKVMDVNSRLRFYKFHVEDVIEVEYVNDNVTFIDFPHNKIDNMEKIKSNIEYLTRYFDGAGLKGKKFLFDTKLGLAIRDNDFVPTSKPFIDRERVGIMTQPSDEESDYVLKANSVMIFDSFFKYVTVNNSIMSLYNNNYVIQNCKSSITNFGAMSTSLLAGLLSGVVITEQQMVYLNDELCSDNTGIFMCKIAKNAFTSTLASELSRDLKSNKLKDVLYSNLHSEIAEDFSGESINLSRIHDLGLDKFIKSIKDLGKKIVVNIDIVINIKTMFIRNGAAFVTLMPNTTINNIQVLLDSDNIVEIMN